MRIEPTSDFQHKAKRLGKKYRSLDADIAQLGQELSVNPRLGTPLGRDCYKIRFQISSKNRGKSSGGRVVTCVKIVRDTVYLLTIFDKSEKSALDETELDEMLQAAGISDI
ncbi:MAG: hypothetical protein ACK4Q5_09690 [Saprospiraceae bacterium]